jgi:hypothetical protein
MDVFKIGVKSSPIGTGKQKTALLARFLFGYE